jgi:tRNA-modifying protein YgfZ
VHEDRVEPTDEADALDRGRAYVELTSLRLTRVEGGDAGGWLGDLLTSDVASLESGHLQRSLLLRPTGGIRADLTLAFDGGGFLLAQDASQPEPVARMLGPYVLSSNVVIVDDITRDVTWFALPGGAWSDAVALGVALPYVPSTLGGGFDLIVGSGRADDVREALRARGTARVGAAAAEIRRIRRGDPRMETDFEAGALPQEAGLDAAVDADKGCFLGQESVARVRNLGHARTVLRHVACVAALAAGDDVVAGGEPAGVVTSAAPASEGGTVALVRLRWDAGEGPWATTDGVSIRPVHHPD